jgi:hypothetical protein
MRIRNCCLLLVAVFVLAACEPRDRTPGMWLSGERVDTPVADWSFTNDVQEVQLETHPWYGVPHSVTVVMAASADGELYVPSIYSEPEPFPGTKFWNGIIAENPEVLLRVGDKLSPRRAVPMLDDAGYQRGFEALAAKYPFWRTALEDPAKRPHFVIIRLEAP